MKIFVNIDVWPFVHREVELRVRQNVANAVGEEEIMCYASREKSEINFS